MNLYPEAIESGDGASRVALYPTPGTVTLVTLPEGPVRGQIGTSGRAFAVGGSAFCEVFADGTIHNYGTIANNSSPVSMAAGTTQILIASAGFVYVFDLNTNILTPIDQAVLTNVNQVGYCDGFFLALLNNSKTFQASALLDATTWPPLSVTTENIFIDNVLALLVDHREVWLFGLNRSVVYYDSGAAPFPFDVVPGGMIEQGIGAQNSPVRLDNSVFWLGGDERGNMIAWRANGYTPQRVSNHAVEFAWQGYKVVSDAVGYSYQDQGHSFWVLYFPTADKTWVYDVATGMWHERGFWDSINGRFAAHHSQNHLFSFNKHLVGDPKSGKIYQMSISLVDDDGQAIRRVRRAPHISKEQKWSFISQLQVYVESGLGPIPPLPSPPTTAQGISQYQVLQDSNLVDWDVYVDDNGILNSSNVGVLGAPTALFLNDQMLGSTSWQIGITIGGLLTATLVAYDGSYPTSLTLASVPSSFPFSLTVVNGLLTTSPGGVTPALPNVRGPIINLRWSVDGGHTWSNEYPADIGQAGQYRKRAMWRRLGRSRDRVFEISYADPAPLRIIDAYIEAS